MVVPAGYKDTEIGTVPEDWSTATIDSTCSCFSGGTPNTAIRRYYSKGTIPWITSSDLNRIRIYSVPARITPEGLACSSAKIVEPGAVLLALYGATAGVVAMTDIRAAINQAVLALIPKDMRLSPEFLFYYLQFAKERLVRTYTQGGQPNLSGEVVKAFSIPIPQRAEQDLITAALGDADSCLDAFDLLIAKKRDLRQAAMQQLLTGQTRLPGFNGDWQTKRLSELAETHRLNIIPANHPDQEFWHYSLPAFDDGKHPRLERGSEIGSNKLLVPAGAVLVSKLNPRIPRMWAPDHIAANSVASTEWVILTPRERVDRMFLLATCSSSAFCQQMELLATGTTGSHQRVDPAEVLDIEMHVPIDTLEQSAIAALVTDIDLESVALEMQRAKVNDLKTAMLQALLTGRTRLVARELTHA